MVAERDSSVRRLERNEILERRKRLEAAVNVANRQCASFSHASRLRLQTAHAGSAADFPVYRTVFALPDSPCGGKRGAGADLGCCAFGLRLAARRSAINCAISSWARQ